jgi:8-oxo-dGTP pyrophosphatase MutT (NUDIX family)
LRPELDAITTRGRLLAEYDQAAWHATDAVVALHPDQSAVRGYLARRRADGLWEVVFGRLDPARNAFVIA